MLHVKNARSISRINCPQHAAKMIELVMKKNHCWQWGASFEITVFKIKILFAIM